LITTRPARVRDAAFILQMLFAAGTQKDAPGSEEEMDEYLAQDPGVPRYVEGWGRPGDAGLIMEDDGTPVGAAWYRLFTEAEPGFGFVGSDVPEFGIALLSDHRDRGLGRRLLEELLELARSQGYTRVSLSVAPDNARARHVYAAMGFTEVAIDEEGYSTMVLSLDDAPSGTP
jgi:ribosomal protein S18 acetylase RimI-like enzyme